MKSLLILVSLLVFSKVVSQQNYTYYETKRYFNNGYVSAIGFSNNINKEINFYAGHLRIKYFNLGIISNTVIHPSFINEVKDDYFTSHNILSKTGPWGLSYPIYFGRISTLTANANFYYIFNNYNHNYDENAKVRESVPGFEFSLKYELPGF